MAAAALCLTPAAYATSVAVAGVFPGKALLVIDGGMPRAVALGQQTAEGVRVASIDGDSVTLEVDGRKRTLRVGQDVVSQKGGGGHETVLLAADDHGHYVTDGQINGHPVRFMVDTGATRVSLGTDEAARLGIDWQKGRPGAVSTANGVVRVWTVRLDSVRVGDLTLYGVEAAVHASSLPTILLGMSFLSRVDMRNDGTTLTLTKRY